MSILVISASSTNAMQLIVNGSQKKAEQFVEKLMSVPDKNQKQRLYTFLNCLKRINQNIPGIYQSDIRRLLAPHLWAVIVQENLNNPESFSYRYGRARVCNLENEDEKQYLLQKYFPPNRIQMHDDVVTYDVRTPTCCGISCCCCLKPCVSSDSCPAETCLILCCLFCCLDCGG